MRQGWCPTLFAPMPAADGLLVRIKPPLGRLTADQARLVAAHATGGAALTNRGNLQLRGLSAAAVDALAVAMVDAGLAVADPELERRRNVTVSPLAGSDPGVAADTAAMALAIEAALADPCFAGVPDKFAVVVDGGGVLGLAGLRAQVRVVVGPKRPHPPIAARRAPSSPAQARERAFSFSLSRLGASEGFSFSLSRARAGEGRGEGACSGEGACVGFTPYPATDRGCFGLGLPFGDLPVIALHHLADLAERHGDGTIRLTPWRAVLLPGVRSAAGTADLVADPADPRLAVQACVGRPGCDRATVDARADARALLAAGLSGLHVSGCTKGCAHPNPAATTLVGRDGRYDLVRNGRAADPPFAHGLRLGDVMRLLA